MKIDKNIIKELTDYLNEFNLTEIEYTDKDTKIKVSKSNTANSSQIMSVAASAPSSSNLEKTLRNAYQLAASNKHEFVTLEHLLFSLIDDKDALSVLNACALDILLLKNNLDEFIITPEEIIEIFKAYKNRIKSKIIITLFDYPDIEISIKQKNLNREIINIGPDE